MKLGEWGEIFVAGQVGTPLRNVQQEQIVTHTLMSDHPPPPPSFIFNNI